MNANLASATHQPAPPPGRMWLVAGFILTSLVTASLTVGGNLIVAQQAATRAEKIERVSAFEKSTQPFRELVAEYSTALIDNENLEVPRAALQKSIYAQDASLSTSRLYLKGEARARADAYRVLLADMANALEEADDPVKAMQFARLAVKADREASIITVELRKAADLEVAGSAV